MRVFLILIIFAIGFSGYSAAAHAFGPDSCDPAMKAEMSASGMDQGMDMSDCPGHQADQDKKTDADQSKSSKTKCMDCTHCCASHAMNLPDYSMSFQPQTTVLNLPPTTGIDGDYLMSLLRPPKSFV